MTYDDAKMECQRLAAHYGLKDPSIPERVRLRMMAAGNIKDPLQRALALQRQINRFFTHCLAAWAKGKRYARGPDTPESREADAKKAESLARMLEKKGDPKAAQQQRRRAAELRGTT